MTIEHEKTQSQFTEKTRLIHEVIAKVEDPELRRKILANIVNDRDGNKTLLIREIIEKIEDINLRTTMLKQIVEGKGAGAPRTGRRRRKRRSFVKEELLAWGVPAENVDAYMKLSADVLTRFDWYMPNHIRQKKHVENLPETIKEELFLMKLCRIFY